MNECSPANALTVENMDDFKGLQSDQVTEAEALCNVSDAL